MSEFKPIRWSTFVSLPLVVAATAVVFFLLARLEQQQIVSQLTERSVRARDDEAVMAVRQLGQMPRPPIKPLAAAAASPSRSVALEAQAVISEMLRNWQRQLLAGKYKRTVASQLELLAATLDQQTDRFCQLDYPWLARTAAKIVELANEAPLGAQPQLAIHCDSLLTKVNDHNLGSAAVKQNPPPPVDRSIVVPTGPSADTAVPESIYSSPSASAIEMLLPTQTAERARDKTNYVAWNPRWQRPLGAAAPAAAPRMESTPSTIPSEPSAREPSAPSTTNELVTLRNRELIDRWLMADGREARALERELHSRGFGHLSSEVVRPLLHDDAAGRSRMVYDLMGLPGLNTKAWLALLAEDDSADVRFAAVSVMATSSDRELLDKAWQVVLHDRDPRISSLAAPLQARRSSLNRR